MNGRRMDRENCIAVFGTTGALLEEDAARKIGSAPKNEWRWKFGSNYRIPPSGPSPTMAINEVKDESKVLAIETASEKRKSFRAKFFESRRMNPGATIA